MAEGGGNSNESFHYAVVDLGNHGMAVVSTNWLLRSAACYLPPDSFTSKLRSLANDHEPFNTDTWKLYSCRILYEDAEFSKVEEYVKLAPDTTTLKTEDEMPTATTKKSPRSTTGASLDRPGDESKVKELVSAIGVLNIQPNCLEAKVVDGEGCLPDDMDYPLKTMEDVKELETKLKAEPYRNNMITRLSRSKGKDLRATVANIWDKLLSDDVQSKFTCHGTPSKFALNKLILYNVVFDAVRRINDYGTTTINEFDLVCQKFIKDVTTRERIVNEQQARRRLNLNKPSD